MNITNYYTTHVFYHRFSNQIDIQWNKCHCSFMFGYHIMKFLVYTTEAVLPLHMQNIDYQFMRMWKRRNMKLNKIWITIEICLVKPSQNYKMKPPRCGIIKLDFYCEGSVLMKWLFRITTDKDISNLISFHGIQMRKNNSYVSNAKLI